MKIVLLDALTLGDSDLSVFDTLGELTVYQTTDAKQTVERLVGQEVIITNKVVITAQHMADNPQLKLICISATGTNNVDLEAANAAGIEVKNVSGYSTESVSQATFSLLFQLIHQSRYYDQYITEKKWCESPVFTHIERSFFEIKGKHWGVIAMGEIGQRVAQLASAFGCDVCYYSTSGKNSQQSIPQVDLQTLLSECDVISIHAPLNAQTENLIGAEELQQLKPGAIILNLGRGGIIDESAMATALDTQDIYHGTDVLAVEPMLAEHPYFSVKAEHRLVVTPHTAWASVEARASLIEKVANNIRTFSV
ncbi:D-2-hydroxyacid dehydrogenase [Psychromonas sp. 14N.309.X.WAT.B.A12]|uniref:D-2-hydroxyacid dehydrogenase n=1 Tax=Psychromonas sp. 14N.309.X.WAT.B.A12 TaxID=2998322 RepID=UPI0025B22241|nr:D-2-hydroxyacid dehydrogenase [Psychromonas sp. 14N.309.X.WAT.B.A12]MDN2662998.1 D-2-hydroxyacid dehydrogenase [Psychromonas sp. 14N.309.X.WAT.B.A12]